MDLFLLGVRSLIEKYNYKTAPIKRIVAKEHYGLNDSWYGGNIKCMAELKQSKIVLVLDNSHNILDVAVYKEHLGEVDMNTLKEFAKKKGIEFSFKITKDELIEKILAEV